MEHVAILRKSWGLTAKILTGQKKIESRWYKDKYSPWDKIHKGEAIYFKESGEPVTIKARVGKVVQFSNLTQDKVKGLLQRHGKDIGIEKQDIPEYFKLFKDKRYCILIFLENPEQVQPFIINKNGYGMMTAWMTVPSIEVLK